MYFSCFCFLPSATLYLSIFLYLLVFSNSHTIFNFSFFWVTLIFLTPTHPTFNFSFFLHLPSPHIHSHTEKRNPVINLSFLLVPPVPLYNLNFFPSYLFHKRLQCHPLAGFCNSLFCNSWGGSSSHSFFSAHSLARRAAGLQLLQLFLLSFILSHRVSMYLTQVVATANTTTSFSTAASDVRRHADNHILFARSDNLHVFEENLYFC